MPIDPNLLLQKCTCVNCRTIYDNYDSFYKVFRGKKHKNLFIIENKDDSKYLAVCKDCLSKVFAQYAMSYRGSDQKALKRICMIFDLYYSDDLYEESKDKNGVFSLGIFFRKLNTQKYRNNTFDTALDEDFVFDPDKPVVRRIVEEQPDEPPPQVTDDDVDPRDVEKWGDGLSLVDYDTLNSHYNFLKAANPDCDTNQEIFIIDLCYTKMMQMRALRENSIDDYNKMTDSYRKTFTQSKLQVVRETAITEDTSFGVNIEAIEKYTPAEFYRNKSLYKDFDNIGDYITRFLLRPLRNLMHGTKDRDYEFYVKEEDEGDTSDYSDDE